MTLVELLQQAASESDTPNTSIEGKAANLIERQAVQIEMMREALGYRIDHPKVITALSFTPDQALEQFAERVREQCAQMLLNGSFLHDQSPARLLAIEAAKAIRAIKELP